MWKMRGLEGANGGSDRAEAALCCRMPDGIGGLSRDRMPEPMAEFKGSAERALGRGRAVPGGRRRIGGRSPISAGRRKRAAGTRGHAAR